MAKKNKPPATRERRKEIGGPYLSMAVFCERVLTEKDEVASIVRVIDSITVRANTATIPNGILEARAMLMFKGGDVDGTLPVKLTLRDPQLRVLKKLETTVTVPTKEKGQHAGANLYVPMHIPVKEAGLHLLDIHLRGKLMTRMPLRIHYEQVDEKAD